MVTKPLSLSQRDDHGFERLPASKVAPDVPGITSTFVQLQRAASLSAILLRQPVHEPAYQPFEELSTLTLLLKLKDPQLYAHSRRVQYLAICLAQCLELPQTEIITVGLGALFHDIGKIGIDDELLQKPVQLTIAEYDVVKEHPASGALILSQFRGMEKVIPLVYHHHERWDGLGYPGGLQVEDIPLGARIVAIADAFDAMTSKRNYASPRTPAQAYAELLRCAGTQFDPFLVNRFCGMRKTPLHVASLLLI